VGLRPPPALRAHEDARWEAHGFADSPVALFRHPFGIVRAGSEAHAFAGLTRDVIPPSLRDCARRFGGPRVREREDHGFADSPVALFRHPFGIVRAGSEAHAIATEAHGSATEAHGFATEVNGFADSRVALFRHPFGIVRAGSEAHRSATEAHGFVTEVNGFADSRVALFRHPFGIAYRRWRSTTRIYKGRPFLKMWGFLAFDRAD
jgi:hypothetical protein